MSLSDTASTKATESAAPVALGDSQGRLPYRPALDGVRALAVLAVIAYHADAPWMPGGFFGVDIFFVLSGFLITTLLLSERHRERRINLRAFWGRRLRRLLPALLMVLAVVSLWAAWSANPSAAHRFRSDAFFSLGYAANWRFIFGGTSYFDSFTGANPLRHFWSLAIEEQFYLIWPIVLAFVLAFRRRVDGKLLAFVLVGAGVSAVLMAVQFEPGDPSRSYFGTDTHAFGLLLGAAAAIYCARYGVPRFTAKAAIVALPALLLFLVVAQDDAAYNYYGVMFLGAVLAMVVVVGATQHGPITRVLSWRPLVVVGVVSYGLYLWHWPIWVILDDDRLGVNGVAADLVRCCILAVITAASYLLIEKPIRSGAWRGWRIRVLTPAAVAGVVVIVLVASAAPPVFTPAITAAEARAASKARASRTAAPPLKPSVLIVGDSTAATAATGFEAVLGTDYRIVPAGAVPDEPGLFCPLDLDYEAVGDPDRVLVRPLESTCNWSVKWPPLVRYVEPSVVVVMFSLWDARRHEVHGQWLEPGTTAWNDHLVARARCAVDVLTRKGAHVVFVLAPRMIHLPSEWVAALNRAFTAVAVLDPQRVSVVDVDKPITDGGQTYRLDGVHYTEEGARVLAGIVRPVVDAARDAPRSTPSPKRPDCSPGAVG